MAHSSSTSLILRETLGLSLAFVCVWGASYLTPNVSASEGALDSPRVSVLITAPGKPLGTPPPTQPTSEQALSALTISELTWPDSAIAFTISPQVQMPSDPASATLTFQLAEKNNPAQILSINDVQADKTDEGTRVILSTSPWEGNKEYTLTLDPAFLTTTNGEMLLETAVTYTIRADQPAPTLAPENETLIPLSDRGYTQAVSATLPDATDMTIATTQRDEDYRVNITWKPNTDNGESVKQFLYRSGSVSTEWELLAAFDQSTKDYALTEKPNQQPTYKLIQRDELGNESAGLIRSVTLPPIEQTHPLGLVLILMGAIVVVGVMTRVRQYQRAQREQA